MEKEIVVYGTVFGRSVANLAIMLGWKVVGFFDDTIPVGTKIGEFGVTLDIERVFNNTEHTVNVAIAVAKPAGKQKLHERLSAYANVAFPPLVAPTAIIAPDVKIENGVIVSHLAIISTGVKLGKFVLMDVKSLVGHGASVGDYSSLLASSHISGNVKMGSGCFWGAQSFLIEKKTVGNNVNVAAGSVVFTDVPADVTLMGNPATILTRHRK